MDSELLYLKKRVNFHRRMARESLCGEARWAHNQFVPAYVRRIEDWKSQVRTGQASVNGATPSTARAILSLASQGAARPELVK